jgi:PTH1 family peptidyl-tRNA hydrolase
LGRLGKREAEALTAVFDETMRVLPDAANGNMAAAMNRLHGFDANA